MHMPEAAERLDADRATALVEALSGWQYDAARGGMITRTFTFADFVQAFAFMTQIALVAQQRDHHPEWSNVYNRVAITLTTHDAGGLSQRDIDLARYANQAFERFAAPG